MYVLAANKHTGLSNNTRRFIGTIETQKESLVIRCNANANMVTGAGWAINTKIYSALS